MYTFFFITCIILLVILMQKLVECKLVISSEINGNKDCNIFVGKGYYKKEDNRISVYFSNNDMKYKYVYSNDCLIISCNDSEYEFKVNEYRLGKIKNGDYIFGITTFATRIDVNDSCICLDYILSQQGSKIGNYSTELSFS